MSASSKIRRPALIFALMAFLSAALPLAAQTAAPTPPSGKLLTVAEATDYKQTSLHTDVLAFLRELQKRTPYLRIETLCRSTEGKDVPLVIVGNPLPVSPLDARNAGKTVVYIQANIHAGEVEGKEASLMLLRDILTQEKPPYLDKLVLLVAPIFNADGNDKIDPKSRPQQPGPEKGVGSRYNGQNLDLNRDAIKAESPEVQGLLRNVLARWDPALLVDCHTTDGAYHEQTVTYAWPVNPNGDNALIEYQRSTMLPAIQKIMKDKYKTLGLEYGGFRDFRAPEKGWETIDPQALYITNATGLRNRMAILDENYVHADFKTRVAGNYAFLRAILDYAAPHAVEIQKMIIEADARTIARGLNPTAEDKFGVEFEVKPLPQPVTVLGFVTEIIPREGAPYPMMRPTDKKITYTIPYFADYSAVKSVPWPAGYLMTAPSQEAVEKLLVQGILVERLLEPLRVEVQAFKLKEIKGADRIYQGHRINTVKGEYALETRDFPAGTYFITTAQPLAVLAATILEPESKDGLLAWNAFDRDIVPQWSRTLAAYPVYKLLKPALLVKQTVRESR